MSSNKKILLMGRPNSGKTHFAGQLYIRLISRAGQYKAKMNPSDLTLLKEVVDKLNSGLAADHTSAGLHKNLPLVIEDQNGRILDISLPEYGGEQVNEIVRNRRINSGWMAQLELSDTWVMFIKLTDLKSNDDIISRGLPDLEEVKKRNGTSTALQLSDHAFYIELLQTLIYAKRLSTIEYVKEHKLVVVLSCWDLIPNIPKGEKPSDVLKKHLSILFQYINSTWGEEGYTVIGLSSTEKTLHESNPDSDYLDKGPEKFGYLITSDGKKQQDITEVIPILFN